jgi:branched-subunit amino acid ABC-type transport system permease component
LSPPSTIPPRCAYHAVPGTPAIADILQAVGALVVGVGEELSLLFLSPAYRSAVGFLAILLVLTLRPRGILGARAY